MSAANSHVPATIGSYVIENALAHGSMGTVYLARHSLTYARVALKVLRTEPTGDRQAEERFLREVRAAAQIGHEGIVKVQDAGRTSDGYLFLAMELLTGETFEERIARSTGERLTAMDWLLAMLEPLAAAHAHGIVHRDLKPANVFIARARDGKEEIKLLDFGLARDTREKSGTQTGIALGTPYYMSPEQAARPKDVTPASDVWSVGVMMYEVLTRHMPFDGETLHAVVIHAAIQPHVPTGERAPSLDSGLAALVDACLSKAPEQRPRDASELRAALAPLLANAAVRADLANARTLAMRGTVEMRGTVDEHAARTVDSEPMPGFADTAIALAHDSRIQDVYPRTKTAGLGVWISTLAVLGLAIAGFFWALERSADRGNVTPAPDLGDPPEPRPTRTQPQTRVPVAHDEPETNVPGALAPEGPQPPATNTARRTPNRAESKRASGTPAANGPGAAPMPVPPDESAPEAAPLPSAEAPAPTLPPATELPAAPSGEVHPATGSEPAAEPAPPTAPSRAEPSGAQPELQPEPQPAAPVSP